MTTTQKYNIEVTHADGSTAAGTMISSPCDFMHDVNFPIKADDLEVFMFAFFEGGFYHYCEEDDAIMYAMSNDESGHLDAYGVPYDDDYDEETYTSFLECETPNEEAAEIAMYTVKVIAAEYLSIEEFAALKAEYIAREYALKSTIAKTLDVTAVENLAPNAGEIEPQPHHVNAVLTLKDGRTYEVEYLTELNTHKITQTY